MRDSDPHEISTKDIIFEQGRFQIPVVYVASFQNPERLKLDCGIKK